MEFTQILSSLRENLLKEGYYFKPPSYKGPANFSHINNGFCGVFSSSVLALGITGVELCCSGSIGSPEDEPFRCFDSKLPDHYFLYYKGKYYDAECVEGVTDPLNLPIFEEAQG